MINFLSIIIFPSSRSTHTHLHVTKQKPTMYTPTLPAALALLLTTTLTNAHPTANLTSRSTLTAQGLQSIAPTSNTCAGAKQPSECQTAAQALAPLLASFQTYGINDPATQAAVLSTAAFESGDFKFAHHYFPSKVPGQGTRNMQSKAFNDKYAQSIAAGNPAFKQKLAGVSASDPDAVVSLLVSYKDYDFGSAAWFLTSQCDKSVVQGLQQAGDKSFAAYLGCIGTSPSSDRTAYYNRALAALGVKSS